MLRVLWLSTASGVAGTALGALAVGREAPGQRRQCMLLALSAGVMVGVVCFHLLPEGLQMLPPLLCLAALLFGAGGIALLQGPLARLLQARGRGDLRTGLLLLGALALHNIPEGLAIGAGDETDAAMGAALAALIALHDLPEGMAIAVGLRRGGVGFWGTLGLCAAAGAPTLVGGLLGAGMGRLGPEALGAALCLAAGAMAYVTAVELLPQACRGGRWAWLWGLLGVALAYGMGLRGV